MRQIYLLKGIKLKTTSNIIHKGNLSQDKEIQERQGWFLGHFMNQSSPFYSKDFEVKWRMHPKGWKKEGIKNDESKTLNVLIEGKFKITFKENNHRVVLSRKGDYVLYHTSPHIGEALEDTTIITIR